MNTDERAERFYLAALTGLLATANSSVDQISAPANAVDIGRRAMQAFDDDAIRRRPIPIAVRPKHSGFVWPTPE